MLHHLWWFLAGGWIGSFVTLVILAILKMNEKVPKPYDDETEPHDQAMKIGSRPQQLQH
jgi:hypothetical protein